MNAIWAKILFISLSKIGMIIQLSMIKRKKTHCGPYCLIPN